MSYSLTDIAAALDARLEGRGEIVISSAAEPADAGPTDLAMAMSPRYADSLAAGQARAAVLWEGADWRALGLEAALFVTHPRRAMAGVTRLLDKGPDIAEGIHPSAVIDPGAVLGEGVSIAPLVVIGPGARIGARARIGAGCVIGADVALGEDALLKPGVRIAYGVQIGARFIAQPGAVIGGDGFSFVTMEHSSPGKAPASQGEAPVTASGNRALRIHSLGAVSIGDDVEIGANSCIDRGTIRDTRIGHGTKIDNMVHIGHNVVIGDDCALCGQVAVGGSVRMGNRVFVGGASVVNDNISVGDDVIISGGSGVASNVRAGQMMYGTPALRKEQQAEIYKALRRLPRLVAQVAEMRAELNALSERDSTLAANDLAGGPAGLTAKD